MPGPSLSGRKATIPAGTGCAVNFDFYRFPEPAEMTIVETLGLLVGGYVDPRPDSPCGFMRGPGRIYITIRRDLVSLVP